jgi:hypothetical protein
MTGMARTAALKNGLVFLSLTPPQAGYWCSRFARRPDVSLIWRGKRPDHGNGLRPRIPKQPLEFYSCATKSHPLTRTCPCEPVTRRVWAPIGERPIAHGPLCHGVRFTGDRRNLEPSHVRPSPRNVRAANPLLQCLPFATGKAGHEAGRSKTPAPESIDDPAARNKRVFARAAIAQHCYNR